MNDKHKLTSDAERNDEERALRRAERQAREVAARTGTPLVVYRDGKVEKQRLVDGAVTSASEQVGQASKADS